MARSLNAGEVAGVLILGAIGIWWFVGNGAADATRHTMQEITDKVASDQVTQYGIAKRNGTKADLCVAAMGVTAAFLQAKDEANYATWKKTQHVDCAAAGMPDQ